MWWEHCICNTVGHSLGRRLFDTLLLSLSMDGDGGAAHDFPRQTTQKHLAVMLVRHGSNNFSLVR